MSDPSLAMLREQIRGASVLAQAVNHRLRETEAHPTTAAILGSLVAAQDHVDLLLHQLAHAEGARP